MGQPFGDNAFVFLGGLMAMHGCQIPPHICHSINSIECNFVEVFAIYLARGGESGKRSEDTFAFLLIMIIT
jgi:hypothetical protein